jgi:dynamin 1-like protein
VVSELLRERLGPTSEYTSSLVAIQAAYINTNHPEFVAGSAAIAREGAPSSSQPRKAASLDEADDVSDSVDSDAEDDHAAPNGNAHKGRSVSQSLHQAQGMHITAPVPRHLNEKSDRHRSTSGGTLSAPPVNHQMGLAGTSPHSARETFLNYFFGGQDGQPGSGQPPMSTNRGPIVSQTSARGTKTGARDMFPDLGTRGSHGASSSRGQNTLEANSAYDMKSLGKHLEAVSVVLA